jgi:SAM-dependent methyltransferase
MTPFCRSRRADGPEILDGLVVGQNVAPGHYAKIMSEVALLNRWTSGQHFILEFKRLLSAHPSSAPGEPIRVLDIGCGEGDRLLALAEVFLRSADSRSLCLTGLDLNGGALRQAEARASAWLKSHATERVHFVWVEDDAIRHLSRDGMDARYDWICNSLMTHHLTDEEVIALVGVMDRVAQWGWYIEDLHRHRLAHWGIRLLTAALRLTPEVQHDAPLSVARGFRRADWVRLTSRLVPPLTQRPSIEWRWAFRYVVRGGRSV